MSAEERTSVLRERQLQQVPWHGPPHYESDSQIYLISAACYEHKHIVGLSPARMAAFETELITAAESACQQIFAWNLLPNHYHLLVYAVNIKMLLTVLGKLHGKTSYHWNGEEQQRGRHVWHRAAETGMKSERHFYASFNYVLHNAVRHGYVEHWQDWPYSNARQYLEKVGREECLRRWNEYPILDYGKDWDPPEL